MITGSSSNTKALEFCSELTTEIYTILEKNNIEVYYHDVEPEENGSISCTVNLVGSNYTMIYKNGVAATFTNDTPTHVSFDAEHFMTDKVRATATYILLMLDIIKPTEYGSPETAG